MNTDDHLERKAEIPPEFRGLTGPTVPPCAQELADRQAIGDLVRIYALAIDMRDPERLLTCFDPDGIGEGSLGSGPLHEVIRKTYEGTFAFVRTQHTIINQMIAVDGDEAVMWSYGVAYHIRASDDPGGNLTVGVQYRDKCRRTDKGWLITHRKVAVQWADGKFPEFNT